MAKSEFSKYRREMNPISTAVDGLPAVDDDGYENELPDFQQYLKNDPTTTNISSKTLESILEKLKTDQVEEEKSFLGEERWSSLESWGNSLRQANSSEFFSIAIVLETLDAVGSKEDLQLQIDDFYIQNLTAIKQLYKKQLLPVHVLDDDVDSEIQAKMQEISQEMYYQESVRRGMASFLRVVHDHSYQKIRDAQATTAIDTIYTKAQRYNQNLLTYEQLLEVTKLRKELRPDLKLLRENRILPAEFALPGWRDGFFQTYQKWNELIT